MRKSVRSLTAFRLIGAVTAIWLCGPGLALAGGGIDAGAFQTGFLDPLCKFMKITSTCPTLPTGTQIALELSALGNRPPGLVRFGPADFRDAQNNLQSSGGQLESCEVSGTSGFSSCNSISVDTVNPPATSLDNLTPLGFISQQNSLTVAQPGDPLANSFFYAVADRASGLSTQLNLIYDFRLQTNSSFSNGQTVANISLPLERSSGQRRLLFRRRCNSVARGRLAAAPTLRV